MLSAIRQSRLKKTNTDTVSTFPKRPWYINLKKHDQDNKHKIWTLLISETTV